MHSAVGILTARGSMTSHAAVVARGWGKCCVSGCTSIKVNDDEKAEELAAAMVTIKAQPAQTDNDDANLNSQASNNCYVLKFGGDYREIYQAP
ncbi:unnamed protein product [Lathyrus sativus]|nr:unnamed protein product [Lathyrus sativus]CAK8075456.1 unnamed protein product [Lathyrus sativus]